MSKYLPYRTLWRVSSDNTITSFSTQRTSYDHLKENEFLSRQDAEEEVRSRFINVEDSSSESTYYDEEEEEEEDYSSESTYYEEEEEVTESLAVIDYVITSQNVSVFIDGKENIIPRDFKDKNELVDLLLEGDFNDPIIVNAITGLVNVAMKVVKVTNGFVTTSGNELIIDGVKVPTGLANGIITASLRNDNRTETALRNFWNKLKVNPSESAKENLFNFLSCNGMGIREDGDVICYKYLNDNMTDCYTGNTKHTFGEPIEMDRSKVLEDPNIACGAGLHVGNIDYSYNDHSFVILVTFDPKDAVSCPKDHSFQKLRVCKYTPYVLTKDGDLSNHAVITF